MIFGVFGSHSGVISGLVRCMYCFRRGSYRLDNHMLCWLLRLCRRDMVRMRLRFHYKLVSYLCIYSLDMCRLRRMVIGRQWCYLVILMCHRAIFSMVRISGLFHQIFHLVHHDLSANYQPHHQQYPHPP